MVKSKGSRPIQFHPGSATYCVALGNFLNLSEPPSRL